MTVPAPGPVGLLVAPTEPRELKALGASSQVPEKYGADFLWGSPALGLCGVQRKEVRDLVASMNDGRLGKEIVQLQKIEGLRVLVIEGMAGCRWTTEGELLDDFARVSLKQIRGAGWSARLKGIWVEHTNSLFDTALTVRWLHAWSMKERHDSLNRMPGVRGDGWGRTTNEDYARHLLTALPGVGGELAARIVKRFGGVPMSWTVSEEELRQVDGIGKVRAKQLMEVLGDG